MGQQWLRAWKLSAGGVTASGGESTGLRVVFDIKSRLGGTPGNATICLYNLAPSTANTILKAGKGGKVTFSAGYLDSVAEIFTGEMVQVNLGKDNATDTTATIFAKAGDSAHNASPINKTLKAGSTGMDVYKELTKAMGLQEGDVPKKALEALKYPRSVTMFGTARHFMSVDGTFHYDSLNPKVHITQKDDKGKGSPIILNSDTGMIGMPTQNGNGINVRCLMNPEIKKNSIIHINQKSIQRITPDLTIGSASSLQNLNDPDTVFSPHRGDISADGTYRVLSIEHVGDSYGDPWFCELNCLAVGGFATDAQLRTGTV